MEKKSCQDCVFFAEHYVKKDTKFSGLAHGHCRGIKGFGLRNSTDKACAKFVQCSKTEEAENRIERISKSFERMAQEMTAIREILSDDFSGP